MTPDDEALIEARIQAAIARLKAERWRTLYLLFVAAGVGPGVAAAIDWAAEVLSFGVCP